MKKILIPLCLAIALLGTYFFMRGSDQPVNNNNEKAVAKTTAQSTVKKDMVKAPQPTAATANNPPSVTKEISSKSAIKDDEVIMGGERYPKMKLEKIFSAAAGSGPNELGVAEDGGGNGAGSFTISKDGEILITDNINQRISTYRDGKMEELIDLKGKYPKGVSIHNNEIYVLQGQEGDYTKYDIHVYSMDGTKDRVNSISLDPGFLNSLKLNATDDGIEIYASDKTWLASKNGVVNEMVGVPRRGTEESYEVRFDERLQGTGQVVGLVRDAQSGHIATHTLPGAGYGRVNPTTPLSDGGQIIHLETNPAISDHFADNPHHIFIRTDKDGKVVSKGSTPMSATHYNDSNVRVVEDENGEPVIHILQTIGDQTSVSKATLTKQEE